MERLSHNHSDNSEALLSAYIDDAVDVVERRRVESYLQTCPACAQEVRELRMFRELLRELPTVQPRRSFTLDPATVAPPRRLLFPTLRWATLVATALFFVVLSVDTLGVGRGDAGAAFAPASSSTAQKGQPAGAPQLGGSTVGGAPEIMMQPAASPAASGDPMGQGAAGSSHSSLPAGGGSTAVAAGEAPAAASVPESSAALRNAYPGGENPEGGPATVLTGPPAGGTSADQPIQPNVGTNDTAAAETVGLDQQAPAQGSWWASLTLQVAEVVLGVIALLFGAATVWTWRRQI
jgi:anti-sigma factor RsiW